MRSTSFHLTAAALMGMWLCVTPGCGTDEPLERESSLASTADAAVQADLAATADMDMGLADLGPADLSRVDDGGGGGGGGGVGGVGGGGGGGFGGGGGGGGGGVGGGGGGGGTGGVGGGGGGGGGNDMSVANCGANTCAPGEVCCNASCGICTPPGGTCTPDTCAPSDMGPPDLAPDAGGVPCGANTCVAGEVCCDSSCGTCGLANECPAKTMAAAGTCKDTCGDHVCQATDRECCPDCWEKKYQVVLGDHRYAVGTDWIGHHQGLGVLHRLVGQYDRRHDTKLCSPSSALLSLDDSFYDHGRTINPSHINDSSLCKMTIDTVWNDPGEDYGDGHPTPATNGLGAFLACAASIPDAPCDTFCGDCYYTLPAGGGHNSNIDAQMVSRLFSWCATQGFYASLGMPYTANVQKMKYADKISMCDGACGGHDTPYTNNATNEWYQSLDCPVVPFTMSSNNCYQCDTSIPPLDPSTFECMCGNWKVSIHDQGPICLESCAVCGM